MRRAGSLGGGHYTAVARSAVDNLWLDFNDSHVTRDAGPAGPSSSAYMLVFRQAAPAVLASL